MYKMARLSKNPRLSTRLRLSRKSVHFQNSEIENLLTSEPSSPEPCIENVFVETTSEWTVTVLRQRIHQQLIKSLRHYTNVENLFCDSQSDQLKQYFQLSSALELSQAFLFAAFRGQLQCLGVLHELGADVTSCDQAKHLNALHLSAFAGSVECCAWLLVKAPTLWQQANDGLSPLHFAVLGKSAKVTEFLIKNGCQITSNVIHSAVYANSVQCLQLLMTAGVDINAYHDGMTALHFAVDLNHSECLEYLLAISYIAINSRTEKTGYTPLHLAAENGYTNVVKLLISKGADVKKVNNKQQTALHLACKMQYLDTVECLLENLAPVNVVDEDMRTPLHNALKDSVTSTAIVKALVQCKAEVNVCDGFNYTPLHMAAVNEMEDCVSFLILHGAKVTAKTAGGVSALTLIKRKVPICIDSIYKRLTLSLAYTSEQKLKFSFKDLLTNSSIGETGYLQALLDDGEEEILKHPLCRAFLYLKWKKVKSCYILRILLSLIVVLLVNLYIFAKAAEEDCCHWQRKLYEELVESNLTPTADMLETPFKMNICKLKMELNVSACHRYYHLRHHLDFIIPVDSEMNVIQGLIIVFVIFYMARLIFSIPLYNSLKRFFNLLEILELTIAGALCLYFVEMSGSGDESDVGYYCQKLIGVVIVFLSWMHLLIMNGQQFFRKHVVMFTKVSYEVLKLLFVYFSLLFGFTCTFCILFQNQITDFDNPAFGFIRIFAMMTGELNFSEITGKVGTSYVKAMVFLFLALFIILITFVLMNLMVGIAVNDVEGLYKTAELEKLVQQTQAIHFLEMVCFNGFFPAWIKKGLRKILYLWPNSYQKVIYVRPSHQSKQILPREIIKEGLKLALSKRKTLTAEERRDKEVEFLSTEVKEIRKLLLDIGSKIDTSSEHNAAFVQKLEHKMDYVDKKITKLGTAQETRNSKR